MTFTTLVVTSSSEDTAKLSSLRNICQSLASLLGEKVEVALVSTDAGTELRDQISELTGNGLESIEPTSRSSPIPMTAAPMIYREDGKPDWGSMWQTFCELALYGGPPHRGPDAPVLAPVEDGQTGPDDTIEEIRRGIWETTGLYSERGEPGWLALICHSRRMAAWMCAAIILENVDARCAEEALYVPASGSFELKDEVKSVITVVAKVNHYWQAHLEAQAGRSG